MVTRSHGQLYEDLNVWRQCARYWRCNCLSISFHLIAQHDDVIKWSHFPRNWPFMRGIHRSPKNSPHKGQWRGDLMFSLICVWIHGWVNNREAGDLRRYRAHHDLIVMERGIVLCIAIIYPCWDNDMHLCAMIRWKLTNKAGTYVVGKTFVLGFLYFYSCISQTWLNIKKYHVF